MKKLFSLAWFWFAIVFVSNLYLLISTLYQTLITNDFVRDLYRISTSKNLFEIRWCINSSQRRSISRIRNLYQNYELTQQEYQNPDSSDVLMRM
jgi:hypothetical protein